VFTALTFLVTGQTEYVATARKTSDDAEKNTYFGVAAINQMR